MFKGFARIVPQTIVVPEVESHSFVQIELERHLAVWNRSFSWHIEDKDRKILRRIFYHLSFELEQSLLEALAPLELEVKEEKEGYLSPLTTTQMEDIYKGLCKIAMLWLQNCHQRELASMFRCLLSGGFLCSSKRIECEFFI